MDVHDKATRSFNMSRIRSRNTKPETRLRKLLWASSLRGYRVHSSLPGKPDVVFSRKKLAVFVDGCFWHGCPECGDGRTPSSNKRYWNAKRAMNRARDEKRTRQLQEMGWRVVRLWEHRVMKAPHECVAEIAELLGSSRIARKLRKPVSR